MKERPILFSAPMVRAILDGTKTQTRRVVKGLALDWLDNAKFTPEYVASPDNYMCPYGLPGDRLWVREAYCFQSYSEGIALLTYHADSPPVVYPAPMEDGRPEQKEGPHPSIHMPRWSCRIVLEIVSVRVERLNEISEQDAIAEGVDGHDSAGALLTGWYEKPRKAFQRLWEQINGNGSWEQNPWVWVIEFKRTTS